MSTGGDRSGPPPDPFRFWRELYGQNEATWGKVLEQGMGTEAFAQMIGQTLEAYVSFQKALRDSLNRQLETLNLPSRDDFGRLGAQLVALESKIDALDEKLDELQDRLKGREQRLEALIKRLDEQDGKIVELNQGLEVRDRKVAEMLGRFVAPRAGASESGPKSARTRGSARKREDRS